MEELSTYKNDFLHFREELLSFLYRLVAHKQEAEDLTQETYIRAFKKIDTFKGTASFKTWVFAIAVNLAKDSFRARERWGTDWMDLVKDAHIADKNLMARKLKIAESPEVTFVMSEHLNYCFNCVSKTLLLTNQICLLLKEVYAFKISEIMLITHLSEGKVKHLLSDSRKDMTRIFKHKCALINKEGVCSQCTGLNKVFNPEQHTQMEANKLKIVKEKRNKNYEALLDLRLQMVKGMDPLQGETKALHQYLFENSPAWAKEQLKSKVLKDK